MHEEGPQPTSILDLNSACVAALAAMSSSRSLCAVSKVERLSFCREEKPFASENVGVCVIIVKQPFFLCNTFAFL